MSSTTNHREGELSAGQMLGRYELLTPIAHGGMGTVWAARLKGTRGFRKLVAIKTILRTLENSQLENMLFQEATLASQIHHPNVAETLELGEHEGVLYLVMELVYGESLGFILREAQTRGGVPFPVSVNLVGQVCRGLAAAHDLRDDLGRRIGLVHRDISPPNVLVTEAGTVKIVDFGVATTTGGSTCASGEIKGKISYLAPEQLRGEPLDERVDVFTTGILLYLLTVGKHPFRSALESSTIARILSDVPATPPSALVEEYPEALEAVVLRALDKNRATRFQTATELLEALERAWPDAFGPSADEAVAAYVQDLMKDRQFERRATLRMAEELAEKSSPRNSEPLRDSSAPRDSLRSMPAVAASAPPRQVTSQRGALAALGLGCVALGAATVVVPRYLHHQLQVEPLRPALALAARELPTSPPTATPNRELAVGDSDEDTPRVGSGGAAQRTASLALLRVSSPLRPPKRAASAHDGHEERKDRRDSAPEAASSGLAIDEAAPPPAPSNDAPVEMQSSFERPSAELAMNLPAPVQALVRPIATLAPSHPIAPAAAGPQIVPSKIGHARLLIDPSSDAYRVHIPPALERTGQTFRATVNLCVNGAGAVSKVSILHSAGPALDPQITSTLSRWRYRPLEEGGQATPFCYVLNYEVLGQ